MHFLAAFERTVRTNPRQTAILTPDGEQVTYEQLYDRVNALARALDEEIPERRCGVLAANGTLPVETVLAGQRRGVGTVQLPYRAGPAELASMLERTEADGLVFDEANADLGRTIAERLDLRVVYRKGGLARANGIESYDDVIARNAAEPVASSGDEHGIFFTSGTTGQSKAVCFDQQQMWYGSTQVIMEQGLDSTDRALVTTPWYHMVTTNAWILPHLQAGATLVMQPEFDPVEALRLVEDHRITGLLAVPTQLDDLIEVQREREFDLEALSAVRTGGAIVRPDLVERTVEHLSGNLYNTYGLTEGGPNLAFAHPSVQRERPGTVGKESYMWELRVVDDSPPSVEPDPVATVGPGEIGEILARGPGMATEYLDSPAAGERVFLDGWLRTGDIARVDGDGYLYVIDRIDNMIVTGGENVYPQPVENVLNSHPAVRESVVFGQPDEHWGELVTAVVSTGADVTAAELDRFCRDDEEFSDFKRPREYVFVDEPFPRTDTGTVVREQVISEFVTGT